MALAATELCGSGELVSTDDFASRQGSLGFGYLPTAQNGHLQHQHIGLLLLLALIEQRVQVCPACNDVEVSVSLLLLFQLQQIGTDQSNLGEEASFVGGEVLSVRAF